jgi:glucokinase
VSDLNAIAKDNGTQLIGTGIGICELVDQTGKLLSSSTLRWNQDELQSKLAPFGLLHIEADVRAGALAEVHFGLGRQYRNFLFVTIGTGISCCLVIDGRPYAGANGAAGTMASGRLLHLEKLQHARSTISLEQIASGPAMVQRYRSIGGQAATAADLLAAAESGEERAIDVVLSAGYSLGASLGMLVNVLDPSAILIGGGLGLAEGLYRETMISSTREHIWWSGHRSVPIFPAQTGEHGPVIGAAIALWPRRSR